MSGTKLFCLCKRWKRTEREGSENLLVGVTALMKRPISRALFSLDFSELRTPNYRACFCVFVKGFSHISHLPTRMILQKPNEDVNTQLNLLGTSKKPHACECENKQDVELEIVSASTAKHPQKRKRPLFRYFVLR